MTTSNVSYSISEAAEKAKCSVGDVLRLAVTGEIECAIPMIGGALLAGRYSVLIPTRGERPTKNGRPSVMDMMRYNPSDWGQDAADLKSLAGEHAKISTPTIAGDDPVLIAYGLWVVEPVALERLHTVGEAPLPGQVFRPAGIEISMNRLWVIMPPSQSGEVITTGQLRLIARDVDKLCQLAAPFTPEEQEIIQWVRSTYWAEGAKRRNFGTIAEDILEKYEKTHGINKTKARTLEEAARPPELRDKYKARGNNRSKK